MRPLETLHNNLCFNTLNSFLTRMINDRLSPHNSVKINSINNIIENIEKQEIHDVNRKLESLTDSMNKVSINSNIKIIDDTVQNNQLES
jgi:hypothetical protein